MAVKFAGFAMDTPPVQFESLREGAKLRKCSSSDVLSTPPARNAFGLEAHLG